MMTAKSKTPQDLLDFNEVLSNALMELWAHGQAGATRVTVVDIAWMISLVRTPHWAVTLGNVDKNSEPELMEKLHLLVSQTKFGEETMDVYTQWADEPNP